MEWSGTIHFWFFWYAGSVYKHQNQPLEAKLAVSGSTEKRQEYDYFLAGRRFSQKTNKQFFFTFFTLRGKKPQSIDQYTY
jgi:hypothetical protein